MRSMIKSGGLIITILLALSAQAQQMPSSKPAASQAPSDQSIQEMIRAGRGQEAVRSLEVFAGRMPRDKALKARAAKVYESLGDLTAAKAAALEATSGDKPDPQALAVLGRLAAREGNWNEAVSYWRQVVLVTPNDAAAHLDYGNALSHVGDPVGANKEFATYRELLGMRPVPAENGQ